MPIDDAELNKFLQGIYDEDFQSKDRLHREEEPKPRKSINLSDLGPITQIKSHEDMDGTEGPDVIGDDTEIGLF